MCRSTWPLLTRAAASPAPVAFQLKHTNRGFAIQSGMVSLVELEADAYLTCLTHALTTEKEEVMGLLLGEVNTIYLSRTYIYLSYACQTYIHAMCR